MGVGPSTMDFQIQCPFSFRMRNSLNLLTHSSYSSLNNTGGLLSDPITCISSLWCIHFQGYYSFDKFPNLSDVGYCWIGSRIYSRYLRSTMNFSDVRNLWLSRIYSRLSDHKFSDLRSNKFLRSIRDEQVLVSRISRITTSRIITDYNFSYVWLLGSDFSKSYLANMSEKVVLGSDTLSNPRDLHTFNCHVLNTDRSSTNNFFDFYLFET